MALDTHREQRVLDALSGESGLLRGVSFVPPALLAEALGVPPGANPMVAAGETLGLDFAFVRASAEDASSTAEGLASVGTAAFWTVGGPFGLVAAERGWAAALADVVRDREGLASAVMAHVESIGSSLDVASQAGATAVVVAEDLGLATGFLMGPDDAMDILIPALAVIAGSASQHHMPCVLHSDGDIRIFFDSLVRHGFSGVHLGGLGYGEFESQYVLARDAGLAVLGGLDGPDLREGALGAERVSEAAKELGHSRGLLACDDGGLTTLEEMHLLVGALRSLGADKVR